MNIPSFFDLPQSDPEAADALLLPLPYDGTTSYGKGTAQGPAAIWRASTQVEVWDEELDFDLDSLRYHAADPLAPRFSESPEEYVRRVEKEARRLHAFPGLVVGIGGEHSVTPPLVASAVADLLDLSQVTVVQFDAHSDLRNTYHDTRDSHACAMRRLVEAGARVIAIGIRSADREEFYYGRDSGLVTTFTAQQLAEDSAREEELLEMLRGLAGDVYLTIDIDALDPSLCPGTGTPQPGGLGWWQALRYLRTLLKENRERRLIGCDLVETVPQPHTQVNEFTAARLVAKMIAYRFGKRA